MKPDFSEARIYEVLRRVRWPNGIVCPHCGRSRITTHSKFPRTPRRKYLCRDCRRIFTDLSGTPLARTNLPISKWVLCVHFMGQELSTVELAKRLAVKWDTAAHMRRRLASDQSRLIVRLLKAAEGKLV